MLIRKANGRSPTTSTTTQRPFSTPISLQPTPPSRYRNFTTQEGKRPFSYCLVWWYLTIVCGESGWQGSWAHIENGRSPTPAQPPNGRSHPLQSVALRQSKSL
ncbi:MAG: hypothetical protein M5U34_27025 [Chloroflexi bacterium]|nr:hypothetical protein [Chloroflexota bacterium]